MNKMSRLTSIEIRRIFLDYFQKNNHRIIESVSLVPVNDPTLLVVNSGMAPLKPYFTGERIPSSPRLCNIQKCLRTDDIESVGDRHHLTFFEMMGNWSIGDYFKERAIKLAWELIKDIFGFDTSQLYVTVFGGDSKMPDISSDEESFKIWQQIGISEEKIVPLGMKSNFWGPAGTIGPCGPCTEMFIDRGVELGCRKENCGPDCDCGRFLEIWNAGVFMQYYLHGDGSLTELPLKSVDAGAGLERFAVILQGVDSVYETDLLAPITEKVLSGADDSTKIRSIRIIVDHIRGVSFMVADGVLPANIGREYVLRRLLRRTFLHANLLGIQLEEIVNLAMTVVTMFAQFYPELERNRETIKYVISAESDNFEQTMRRGRRELEKVLSHSPSIIKGEDAFRLQDTYGFPFGLTSEVAKERGLQLDEEGFKVCLEEQRKRSRLKRGCKS